MRNKLTTLAAILGLTGCGGCAGSGLTPPAIEPPPAAETAAVPEAAAETADPNAPSPLQKLFLPQDVVVGSPTEVYTRIARGVLTCWFGADGPLKSKYIYHAEAEPVSRGANSQIKIMTRDKEADDPRALRAYRVGISPSQGNTRVEIENFRLPEDLALRLKQDVERWSAVEEGGCGETPVTAGWAADPVAPAVPSKKQKKSTKKEASRP